MILMDLNELIEADIKLRNSLKEIYKPMDFKKMIRHILFISAIKGIVLGLLFSMLIYLVVR